MTWRPSPGDDPEGLADCYGALAEDALLARAERAPEERIHSAPTLGSEAGAERVAPVAGKLADRILALAARAGPYGITNGEVSRDLGVRDVTAWPRVSALRERGKLKDTGRTRPSPATGTAMSVLVLTTPEEEAQVLEERRRQEEAIVEPPGPEAREAAELVREEWALGGMFRTQANLERIIQGAINARLRRLSKAAAKAERRARLRAQEEGSDG